MKIISPSYKIIYISKNPIQRIEEVARTCYKSQSSDSPEESLNLIRRLIQREHFAMLEFAYISVLFVTDRGVSHELVRHRLASYAQESTRFCNYNKNKFNNEISVIRPYWLDWMDEKSFEYFSWKQVCSNSEQTYLKLIQSGCSPQQARTVLPLSLKTEINISTNIREWRHIFKLRALNPKAHPEIRKIMIPLLADLNYKIPVVFEDLWRKLDDKPRV